jgi:glycyl-tRNA synthetase beta subunit
MAEDRKLRENRLALLKRLRGLFLRVADLSQLVAGQG